MNVGKIILMLILMAIMKPGFSQTQTALISQSGWYRIAVNGPMVQGATGGSRAAARFILRDATSSLHQMVEFLAYIHYGRKPSIVVLNNSYHTNALPPFTKLRIVKGGIYEGGAVEVYVNVLSSNPNNEAYFLQDNDQVSGWTALDWQQVSTSSGDQDGVPSGFTAYVIDLQDIVNGFVTDQGRQHSNYNGNFYTSGNILLGKTTQTNTGYKLDVNGNIRASKVVVNTTGADYVFDSAYYLAKLDSLDGYIRTYHHLPGVPSAGEMQEEGLDIGTGQALLLKKIEELTLYIIQLNQKMRDQKMAIITLKNELEEIRQNDY